jgi:hypothetical protein
VGFPLSVAESGELLARDSEFDQAYRELRQYLTVDLRAVLERLIPRGHMRRPDSTQDLSRIATNAFVP